MSAVTERDIKDAYRQIECWPDWMHGRPWQVPIYPKRWSVEPHPSYEPLSPDPIQSVEFWVERAVENRSGRKVWLVYGRHGDLKILCEVWNRKSR